MEVGQSDEFFLLTYHQVMQVNIILWLGNTSRSPEDPWFVSHGMRGIWLYITAVQTSIWFFNKGYCNIIQC